MGGEMTTRTTPWVQTFTGRRFYPLEPSPVEVHILDIAHSLSMQCRWTGHTSCFYSVAEHSVWVSHMVPREHALWGLLHDAAEAYLADLAKPIKNKLRSVQIYEATILRQICKRYGLPFDMPLPVAMADVRMLATEAKHLMGHKLEEYIPAEPYDIELSCLYPEAAKVMFMRRFIELYDASR